MIEITDMQARGVMIDHESQINEALQAGREAERTRVREWAEKRKEKLCSPDDLGCDEARLDEMNALLDFLKEKE